MDELIKRIIKLMNKGMSVDQISDRCGIDEDFADQVLQIYTTHRGIDIQGILDRMPEDLLR